MKEYIKLAWRNIWRNKRRTLITVASVFFTLFFCIIMRSMQVGSYNQMTKNVVEIFSGYIQVHENGYWDDQTIDNTMEYTEKLKQTIASHENVSAIIPRLESFALGSSGSQTKGVIVLGIDPVLEKDLSNPEHFIVKGKYLDPGENGVLVGEKLAKFLSLSIGDTLTLISQGYQGASAAGIYPIVGLVKIPNPSLDKRIVYMGLQTCQSFFGAENRITSLAMNLKNPKKLASTTEFLKENLNNGEYEVMSYKELNPELIQQIESDQSTGFIFLGLLYMIVGFGVFGTVLMMTAERKREFGVMIAMGMQKTKLGLVVAIEMVMLGFVGIISGIIGVIPVILYFVYYPIELKDQMASMVEEFGMEPIMPFALESGFMIGQSLIVIIIFIIAISYPVYSITKLRAIKALRS